jgi:hypothetical protein
MAIEQAIADVLDEAIRALAILDLDALKAMEERLTVLSQSRLIADEIRIASILRKKRVLELVLYHSESNLNALQRLYGRNTRDLWEH